MTGLDLTAELDKQINQLIQEIDKVGIDYSKFNLQSTTLPDNKKAYPNFDSYQYIPGQHNVHKWLQSVHQLYKMEKEGSGRVKSIRQVTSGWNIMETYDFLNWLRYYESGAHMKYKMAQLWYENGAPGYFLHVKPDPIKEPEAPVSGHDIDFARDKANDDGEKRETIEKQRNKIIGRLDSAEKLLRSRDGQMFAGTELEALMESIYQLKKKIQLVNKVSTSTRLYEDMIVRQANVLQRDGFAKAAAFMFETVAQANNPPPDGTGKPGGINVLPPPDPPESPSAPLHPGAPGGLPSMGPGMSQNAPAATGVPNAGPNDNAPNLKGMGPAPTGTAGNGVPTPVPQDDDIKSPGLNDFLQKIDTGNITSYDKSNGEDDNLDIEDTIDVSAIEDEIMVTEAQLAPPADIPITDKPAPVKPSREAVTAPATETPLEVTEDDVAQPPKGDMDPSPQASNFDAKIDQVFSNITVADVVAKLEDISKVFKNREIPRQLGVVDMMLDSLGLASYFPSLSEATNKALESNNYIATRVDDILSKLRGGMEGGKVDLKGESGSDRPEVSGIKNKLTQDADKEKQRKQQRKDQEASELAGGPKAPGAGKETPEVEMAEDLGLKPPARAPAAPAPRPLA
jgi:hypothetical protein